ncbi:retrovirus-related pol polyprotein from transposon TNT 1-94, partial [Tanacetum coccineum]
IDCSLEVPVFKQGDDPIDSINKMMSFVSTVVTSCFPTTNNQLRNSSNPRQQANIHDGRELEFLADPGVVEGPVTQMVITHNAAYQADDLDAYDSDCDDFSTAKAVLMANFSSYGSDVLFEVPHFENTHNDMLNQSVQEMLYSEQTHLVNYPENEITSDSNIIPYSQYLLETQNAVDNLIANESLSAEHERYKERVKLLEERQNVDLKINYLKQTLSEQSKEKELLTKTFNVFKNESKEKEDKNIDKEIALEKKVKELDNIISLGFQNPFYLKKAQQIRPMLYDGSVIAKETNVISIADSEETLMLEEESRSKMLLKQSDPMVLEKKVNIKPINYAELNRLYEDFGRRFVPQQELSDEQAFRLQTLHPNTDQSASSPVKIEAPRELLKTYKQLYDLIKPSHVRAKEHIESLVTQLNQKSVEITDLNAQLQEKVFVITALKNNLSKLKGKDIVDNVVQVEIVEQAKSLNPFDSASYSACKYVKLIQELLGYVRDNCLDITTTSEKLVAITPINKKKTIRRSKSTDNTKNDRFLQISSSNQKKNNVEDHSRIVNFMFDVRLELCFFKFVSDMNASSKSKPTRRTFTLVGNTCPLTRITAANKVPLREPIPLEVVAQESQVTKVYTRRPKGSNTLAAPSSSSLVDLRIMPPRRFKKKSVKRIVEKRVAKAIEEYEKTRADSNNTGGSGSANTGGTVAPDVHGCSYKTFTNSKPHTFNGTEGVVGLKRWFEKMEQVFEICKCAEDDKVKFAVCTFESRALTWWNGNVQTLGLANANQIPWSNVKAMMTTEYCPATEIQRMEQELWTLTLKGDDIEAYNNRFHELVLMCPELVSTEKKKIEKYIRGFPEGIKGNVTSSKPATLHDAINMARELIEQGVQAKALRIGDSNKRKWEDQQGNNYHQQQNRRQEAAKVYVAAPAKGRGYVGTTVVLIWLQWHLSARIPVAGGNSLQNGTCFGCGNQGHYRRGETNQNLNNMDDDINA